MAKRSSYLNYKQKLEQRNLTNNEHIKRLEKIQEDLVYDISQLSEALRIVKPLLNEDGAKTVDRILTRHGSN